MTSTLLDVVAVGTAIVDVIAHATPQFLTDKGLEAGSMQLIDEPQADALYAAMGPGQEVSGGSAANSIAAIAALGGQAAFVGKVKADQLGAVFRHDIQAVGVEFTTAAAVDGPATARCLVLVTPDGQRTMNTYLGASQGLAVTDIDAEQIARAKIMFIEGYAWPSPNLAATLAAVDIARAAGCKVALTLAADWIASNPAFGLSAFIQEKVDVLFANEQEAMALAGVATVDEAVRILAGLCPLVVVTCAERGALVTQGGETLAVPASPVHRVVDTTGAGDLFAGGFLYGLARGLSPAECARIGAVCAAEVIGHLGARPQADLRVLAEIAG